MVLYATLLTLGNGESPLYSLNFPNVQTLEWWRQLSRSMRDAIRTFSFRSSNYELLEIFDGSCTGEWKEYRNVIGVTAINPSKVFGRSPSQTYLLKSSKFTVYSCLPTQLIYLSKLKFWRIIMDGAARRRLNLTLPMMPHAFLKFYSCDPWPVKEAGTACWNMIHLVKNHWLVQYYPTPKKRWSIF